MKDVADAIRRCVPFMNDSQIFGVLVFFHHFIILLPATLFFMFRNIVIRLAFLYFILCIILSELAFGECPLRYIEIEFSDMEPLNLLEMFYDWWGMKNRTREQQVTGFISFNIGLLLALVGFTIFDCIRG